MPDLDLVIKGLEHCREYGYLGGNNCNRYRKDCPYWQLEAGCVAAVLNDVNTMLKEQEAKEVMVVESTNMYTGLPIAHCPKCGVSLDRFLYGRQYEGQINYCPFCGQSIKWE